MNTIMHNSLMYKPIMNKDIFNQFEEYMFTKENIQKFSFTPPIKDAPHAPTPFASTPYAPTPFASTPHAPTPFAPTPHAPTPFAPTPFATSPKYNKTKPLLPLPVPMPTTIDAFMPFQKDKLFWCFYLILKGKDEYDMHRADYFITEKNFKIATVEKLRLVKDKLKELKIKRNEIEDELVNQPQITLKSLNVLCLVYGVSITYLSGKKYYEFLHANESSSEAVKGVIRQTDTKEEMVLYEYNIPDIHANYWKVENAQKPLKVPSAYTVKELQEICKKLDIKLVNDLGKNKTKQILYEEILTKL